MSLYLRQSSLLEKFVSCKDKILSHVHLLVLVDINITYTITVYRSGHFRDDLIFDFFTISFKSQFIEYAEIISSIIFL